MLYNISDRKMKKYGAEKITFQCHFVHHKSHTNCDATGSRPALHGDRPAANNLSHGTADYSI
jgi:hypothetical protein